ncbi:MAG: deoxyribonuclease IV [Candidatus Eremiobacteraeota bacterium]|nr:deoxyribonuclease IV [Candidatus Eremiobacteraeota bacterium]
MRIGLHLRVGRGYAAAIDQAKRAGCTAVQIFSSNPKSYRTGAVDRKALENFKAMRDEAQIDPCAIHTSYLINLASEDPKVSAGSLNLLKYDLEVAGAGGIRYVNTHLGSYGTRDRNEGFVAACRLLEAALETIPDDVYLVMENSAGAGSLCGGTLEELGRFVKSLEHPRLGVCLDTAHAWAAGYEINSQRGVDEFLEQVEAEIGLDRVHMFHFNDTEVPLGGNRDRHHHIGEGNIGFEGFRALASRRELSEKTAILETPGEEADDLRNMETIRAIFAGASAAAR